LHHNVRNPQLKDTNKTDGFTRSEAVSTIFASPPHSKNEWQDIVRKTEDYSHFCPFGWVSAEMSGDFTPCNAHRHFNISAFWGVV
jgi:hypothetical protein